MAIEGNAPEQPAASRDASDDPGQPEGADGGAAHLSGWTARRAQIQRLIDAIRDSDLHAGDEIILRLSRSRRWLAPLALIIGGFAMLFMGVKLLLSNWRLTLIQVLPAMWIWAAMFDLKAHLLHGRTLHVITGPIVIPIVLAVAAVTAASFYLNAVFAYAISGPGPPVIRSAFTQARPHLAVVLGAGAFVGLLLGVATVIFPRWGVYWFGLSLSIVVGLMMICYVAVPARIIGIKTNQPKRDKLAASAVGGAIGAVVCTPPYVLGRVGLIMLGSSALLVPGIILLVIGGTLQAGATSAVKTVKMSAKLVAGRQLEEYSHADEPSHAEEHGQAAVGPASSSPGDEAPGAPAAGPLPRCSVRRRPSPLRKD